MRLTNSQGLNLDDHHYFKSFKDKVYTGHKRVPTALAWNPIGDKLASAQCYLKLWSFEDKLKIERQNDLKAHDTNVQCLAFSNQNLLASMSRDMIKFWDVREQSCIKQLKADKQSKSDFVSFAWNHGGQSVGPLFVVCTKDSVINSYDYRKVSAAMMSVNLKPIYSMQINKIEWDKSDSVLVCVGGQTSSGSICILQGQTLQMIPEGLFTTHCSKITDIAFSNDNDHFATASQDSLVELHNVPEFICERVYSNKLDGSFRRVGFSYDSKYLAASSQSTYIDIYNVKKGGYAHRIDCSSSQQVIAWHPKKMILAYIDEEDRKKSIDKTDINSIFLYSQ